MSSQAFQEDPRLGVITTVKVLGGHPILLVTHDADDGGWQFLCGMTNDPSDGRIVHLHDIVDMDPSVVELHDLPLGWSARSDRRGAPWAREQDCSGDQ